MDVPGSKDVLKRRHRWLVWAILGAGLLLSVLAWSVARMQARQELAERFDAAVSDVQEAVETRIHDYAEVLVGARAYYMADTGHFSGQEFTDYIVALDLGRR